MRFLHCHRKKLTLDSQMSQLQDYRKKKYMLFLLLLWKNDNYSHS